MIRQWLENHIEKVLSFLGGAAVATFVAWSKIGRSVDRQADLLRDQERRVGAVENTQTTHVGKYETGLVRLVQLEGRVAELEHSFREYQTQATEDRRTAQEDRRKMYDSLLRLGDRFEDSVKELKGLVGKALELRARDAAEEEV